MSSRLGRFGPLTLLIGIGILIYALLPKSLFHSFSCQSSGNPAHFSASNGYFVDDQVVVVGPAGEVDTVLGSVVPVTPTPTGPVIFLATVTPGPSGTPPATVTPVAPSTPAPSPEPPLQLRLVENCDLSYLNWRKNPDTTLTEQERKSYVLRLYEVPHNTLQSVIQQITTRAQSQNFKIHADPNYLVRRSDESTDPCGHPNSEGGGTGGKDFGGPSELDPAFYDAQGAANAFENQWAFVGPKGIKLSSVSALPGPSFTGRGVRVVLFDSSPFRINFPFYRKVDAGLPSPLWFRVRDTLAARNIKSSHGEFTAELIHKVAPGSQIELIHVLDDNGCTRLLPLIEAVHAYTSRRTAWSGTLNKTVINMSLGIRVPPSAQGLDDDLDAFHDVIQAADRLGAIFVAAAGNDSGVDATGNPVIVPMQIPANFAEVIGVAATSENGNRSCFSNWGDVAAPGGDGGQDTTDQTDPGKGCVPRTETPTMAPGACTMHNMEHCKYGLISLVHTDTGPQYVFWSGTSFSTPLVAGLAALGYERWSQQRVKCLIQKGAIPVTGSNYVNWGIMDMNNTLSSTSAAQAACSSAYP